MRSSLVALVVSAAACGSFSAACGGSCPGTNTAASAPASPPAGAAEVTSAVERPDTGEGAPATDGSAEGPGPAAAPKDEPEASPPGDAKAGRAGAPEPAFPEHASVAQAIAAVPRGGERANLDPETLGEPLQDEALYAPCKVGGQHFKLKVAVWNGHAVGVDVATPNRKLAECIDERVRGVTWRDKVPSLNTIEYSM